MSERCFPTKRLDPTSRVQSRRNVGKISVLVAIVMTSCADRPPPALGALCERYESPIKNALAEYVERRLLDPRVGDPPLTPYQISEGSRQRLIAVMKEMNASGVSPKQECQPVGDSLCRVQVHCRGNVLNATNTPTTYALVLEERAGTLEPIQLFSRFDGNDPDPISGKINGALQFRFIRSQDAETRLGRIEDRRWNKTILVSKSS